MKLQLKEIGVWVRASDELPEKENDVWIKVDDNRIIRGAVYKKKFMSQEGVHENKTVEWLKPLKEVYVLTPDELEEIMEDFVRKLLSNNLIGANQFIKTKTK